MFERLFSPIKIGKMELKNRIILPALHLGYTPKGAVNDRLIEFYKERALGGAALLIVGGAYVDKLGTGGPGFLAVDDDSYIEGYRKLTEAIHQGGAKAALQLFHAGRYTNSRSSGSQSLAPSAVASKLTREVPKEMTQEDITKTAIAFGEGARRAKEAGFDAIEIIGSTGYLISQFLSPLTNKRTDKYGGSLENRTRFALEVIDAIREKVGKDFPVIFRLTAADLMEGGIPLEENVEIAKILEKAGVDAIDLQVGWHESPIPTVAMSVPRGAFTFLGKAIRDAVSIPISVVNRINNPQLAEELLTQGKADLINMARALIGDPELPNKAREGRLDEIFTCIGCNEGCLDTIFQGQASTCMVNSRAGRELEFQIKPAEKPKKVAVIGAGPAGIQAARFLAMRGHRVTLYDREKEIGGQFRFSSVPPGKGEFSNALRYLDNELKRLEVDRQMGKGISTEDISKQQFDAVIVASGTKPRMPDIKGIERKKVTTSRDILEGKKEAGEKVVVIGAGGIAAETALYLTNQGTIDAETALFLSGYGVIPLKKALQLHNQGRVVTIVRRGNKVAPEVGPSTRWLLLQKLAQAGVKTITEVNYKEITEEGLIIVEKDGTERLLPADTIVIAAGSEADTSLAEELKGKVKELHLIGNANLPGKAFEAFREGMEVAFQI